MCCPCCDHFCFSFVLVNITNWWQGSWWSYTQWNISAFISKVREFQQEWKDWTQYCDKLEYYIQANGIMGENKKKSIFLVVVVGPASLKLLHNLVSPNKPHKKMLQQLITVLKQHYNPTPSVIVPRFKFHTRTRKLSEWIATFTSELRSIADFYNFSNMLEDMLRDKLVCGIADNIIQKRQLAEDPYP